MNGFRRKKVRSLTLGEKLKKIRSGKRASFSDISKNTMIQAEYLEYLEKGEYSKLPADVYVKGFLKSFAEYLGADAEDLIKSFEKEKSIQKNISSGNEKFKKKYRISLSKFYITPKIIYLILTVILFLGLFVYLFVKVDIFVSNPELVILNPKQDNVINESQILVEGKTDKGSQVFVNNQIVTVNDEGIFKEKIILKKGINIITVRSVNRFGKEAIKSISLEARY